MKNKKRHISLEKKLIIALVIAIIIFACLLYVYHNYWKGVYIINNVATSFTGVVIVIVMSLTIFTVCVLGGLLLSILFPAQTESEKQNKSTDD